MSTTQSMLPSSTPVDFKPVLLPKTTLAPKSTPEMEKSLVARDGELHVKVRQACKDKPLWLLHDGPPYANGNVHVGHALNKILKDALVRAHRMNGYDATFTPGWDCHGLPIEWQVEKNILARNADKASRGSVLSFRQECREWAEKWVSKQADGFSRMGVLANWDTPYLTMSHEADSATVSCLHNLLKAGLVYRALRPVQWSVTEKTALADAEVVYKEVRR
jgi:isoleucyl-tRNA synthetase